MARYTINIIGSGTAFEAVAAAALYPGHLVELDSDGKVVKQPTAAVDTERALAMEDSQQGNGIGDVYSTGDRVFYRVFKRGDVVLAVLKDGQNITTDEYLEAATNGEVQVYSAGTKLFQCIEALDVSDSATTALSGRRIVCRVV